MKTSISLPDDIVIRVTAYNRHHPDQPISVSGVCKQALEKKLDEVEGVDKWDYEDTLQMEESK